MAQKWSSKYQWPSKENFVLRVIEEKFGPSNSSGNPMITLECEIATPEEIEIAGEMFIVAGLKIQYYRTTRNLEDAEKDKNNKKQTEEFYQLFGLPTDNIDFDNPPLEFKGKLVHVRLECEEKVQRKAPTKQQIEDAKAKGKRAEGDVLKHPITGKPQISFYPKIGEIFGLAEADAGKPY